MQTFPIDQITDFVGAAGGAQGPDTETVTLSFDQLNEVIASAMAMRKKEEPLLMSFEQFTLIVECINLAVKENEKLHWAVLGTPQRPGANPIIFQEYKTHVIRDIGHAGNVLEVAKKSLTSLFKAQYPDNPRHVITGQHKASLPA